MYNFVIGMVMGIGGGKLVLVFLEVGVVDKRKMMIVYRFWIG